MPATTLTCPPNAWQAHNMSGKYGAAGFRNPLERRTRRCHDRRKPRLRVEEQPSGGLNMVIHESDRKGGSEARKPPGRVWPGWYPVLATFRNSDRRKAVWQLINTLVPYFFLWYLMIRSIQIGYPYTLTLLLALPAAAFLVRIFILFHDCVHSSFFMSKRANTFFGYFLGMLLFTSFEDWRFSHLRHQALTPISIRGDSATSGP